MGLDGFSMSNLGLNRNLSSAQLANAAEDTARQSLDNQIADVDGVGKKEKVGKKDEDAAFNGTIPFISDENKEEEQAHQDEQQNPDTPLIPKQSDDDEEVEKYHFRFGETGQIEVWDNEKKKVIKTISPEEASNVFCNFSKVPGILINRKI